MAHIKFVAAALALLITSTSAFAGFTSARPPPGYSRSPSGATQQPGWGPTYKPAPGEFYDLGKQQWMTSASLNTGGRELVVPVALPVVGSVALAVATAFSSNPAILLGTAAWALYQAYLAQKKITPHSDGRFYQEQEPQVCDPVCYEFSLPGVSSAWTSSNLSLVAAMVAIQTGSYWTALNPSCPSAQSAQCSYDYRRTGTNDPVNTQAVTLQRREIPPPQTMPKLLSPQQVATEMQTIPMTKPLIDALPMPLPVKSPVLNPSPTGQPQVLRVPQGSPSPVPLPNPNPDNLPQQWKTPVVDLIPSPSPDDPWRFEVKPREIIKSDPSPLVDPLNPPDPLNPSDPLPIPSDPTEPGQTVQEKQPGLCDEYPDILACAKPTLDTPETPEIETRPREIEYTPQAGWGSAGACPAPRHLPGANVDFQFTLVCDFMTGIKPVLLTVASLIAGMIIIGARGGAAD